jgi:hypothetical protein
MKISTVLTALQIGFLLACSVEADSLEWFKPSLPSVPPDRCCGSIAYDTATETVVLFGGGNGCAYPAYRYNDTWVFSAKTGWSQIFPATSPSPRQGAGMAYDPTTGTVLLFGGFDVNDVDLNDTWTWDGTTWTQQFPPVSPPAREIDTQGLTHDPLTGTVLMFGGFDGTNSTVKPLQDTWEWNGKTKTWTQKFPALSPPASSPTLAYDARHGNVLLFAGNGTASEPLNQTWSWNGTTWTQLFPEASPSPRALNSMAYDFTIGYVVLFGGIAGNQVLDDTWIWSGSTWVQTQTPYQPGQRYSSAMAVEPYLGGLILFGGIREDNVFLNQTWVFSLL